jgi:serine/threonine-protein kinase
MRDRDGGGDGGGSAASTVYGLVVGTPSYMAPEQAMGATDRIDERTDVFALGALLYHVLCGRAPFGGSSVGEDAVW